MSPQKHESAYIILQKTEKNRRFRKMIEELEHKNLISNFASQRAAKINFNLNN